MIDAAGRSVAFTGENCVDWAGHVVGEGVSVAGNMLAGPAVIETALAAYEANAGLPLAERLLVALQSGERGGGDKRGRQSAARTLVRCETSSWLDLPGDDR